MVQDHEIEVFGHHSGRFNLLVKQVYINDDIIGQNCSSMWGRVNLHNYLS